MNVSHLLVVLLLLQLSGCAAADQVALALNPDQLLRLTSVQQGDPAKGARAARAKPKDAKSRQLQPIISIGSKATLPSWSIAAPRPGGLLRHSLAPSELFKRVSPSVYTVATPGAQGSAVAVSQKELVTTCHVVLQGPTVTLTHGPTTLKADVVSADLQTDRCFLRVQEGELVPVPGFRDYSTLSIGETVYTIGSPRGFTNTLGAGLLSGLRSGDDQKTEFIQITAPLSAGSSGGGLFDDRGNLIGVTSFTIRDSQSLNFALSASQFWR